MPVPQLPTFDQTYQCAQYYDQPTTLFQSQSLPLQTTEPNVSSPPLKKRAGRPSMYTEDERKARKNQSARKSRRKKDETNKLITKQVEQKEQLYSKIQGLDRNMRRLLHNWERAIQPTFMDSLSSNNWN
uniref:BZIP domain-containing protein n=1 Tax=Panagrolaimus sp. JU765 TaxID=591449 RepID=A0AC34R0T9_9BILA